MIKILALAFSLIMLVGCGSGEASAPADSSKAESAQVQAAESKPIEAKKELNQEIQNEPPLRVEDIEVNIVSMEEDSIGTVYVTANYKNNTEVPVTSFEIRALLKDSNETTYLSSFDTVMPGETSPNFESFGPKTKNQSDIQFLAYSFTIPQDDGTEIYLDYDCKLGKYEWF